MVLHDTGVTSEGREHSWGLFAVAKADAQGRFARVEFFPADQWTEALALFDGWVRASAPVEAPGPSNEDAALR
jgi:hypothetical protein